MDEQLEEMLAQLEEADIIITGKVRDVFALIRQLAEIAPDAPVGQLLQAKWN